METIEAKKNGEGQKMFINAENIRYVQYFQATQTLEIGFDSDSMYRYHGVEPKVFEALMNAGSKREYFEHEIFDKYEFRKHR